MLSLVKTYFVDLQKRYDPVSVCWLLWYNGERPHYALEQVASLRAMMLALPAEECQMWWTHTFIC